MTLLNTNPGPLRTRRGDVWGCTALVTIRSESIAPAWKSHSKLMSSTEHWKPILICCKKYALIGGLCGMWSFQSLFTVKWEGISVEWNQTLFWDKVVFERLKSPNVSASVGTLLSGTVFWDKVAFERLKSRNVSASVGTLLSGTVFVSAFSDCSRWEQHVLSIGAGGVPDGMFEEFRLLGLSLAFKAVNV